MRRVCFKVLYVTNALYPSDVSKEYKELIFFITQISSCERCQRINPKLKKGHAPLHPIPVKDEVWHQIGIDLIGPLAITPRGNKYIMTVTDYIIPSGLKLHHFRIKVHLVLLSSCTR